MVATLMKRGYPGHPNNVAETNPLPTGIFPTLTHTLILKDTWAVIVEQMHELGLSTFVKLFRLSANLRWVHANVIEYDNRAEDLFDSLDNLTKKKKGYEVG